MKDFAGKVAVVTGAASGIGRAYVERLGALGMKVVLADVDADALRETARHFASAGREVCGVPTDVSQADAVQALAERTLEVFGGVHVLCNNAGVFAAGPSWLAPQSDYDWVFGVNVQGVLHGLRSFVPLLLEQGEEAHVVNTASMAALTTAPWSAPYTMSKAAVLSLSETLHLEMQARGAPVGVSVLCPELVDTAIGASERSRPAHLQRKDGEGESPERDLVEDAIRQATATGLDPRVLADRAIDAIREKRFYVLPAEGDPWRVACNTRLDDIRLARNPGLVTPGSEAEGA